MSSTTRGGAWQARSAVGHPDDAGTILQPANALDAQGLARAGFSGDESRRWVYHIRVNRRRGLNRRQSAAICLLPGKPRPGRSYWEPTATSAKARRGRGWLPLGGFYANWVGLPDHGEEGAAARLFVDASEEQFSHWLDFLAAQGVTAMRFHAPGPYAAGHGADGPRGPGEHARCSRRSCATWTSPAVTTSVSC